MDRSELLRLVMGVLPREQRTSAGIGYVPPTRERPAPEDDPLMRGAPPVMEPGPTDPNTLAVRAGAPMVPARTMAQVRAGTPLEAPAPALPPPQDAIMARLQGHLRGGVAPVAEPPAPGTSSSMRRSIEVSGPAYTPERIARVQNPIAREFLGKKYAPTPAPDVGHGPLPSPEDAELQDAQSLSAAMQAANAVSRAAAGFTQTMTGAQMDGELYRGLDRGAQAPVANLLQRRGEARDAADYERRAQHQGLQMAQGQQSLAAGAMGLDKAEHEMQQRTTEDDPASELSVRAAALINGMYPQAKAEGMSYSALVKMSPFFRAALERDESLARIRASEASAEASRALARERAQGVQTRFDDTMLWKLQGKIPDSAVASHHRLKRLANVAAGKTIDGAGLLEGGLPQFLRSPEGQATIQTAQMEFNAYIKEMAGSAVTAQEAERMRLALGMVSAARTEDEFRTGVRLLDEAHQSILRKIAAGAPQRTVDTYFERAGLPTPPGTGTPGAPGAAPAPAAAAPPKRTPVSRTPSKDGKWLRLNYADGTSEVVPNG